ncbi:MAG: bifunctional folylpolyglutamate synthase/dihydrofolate synthase [Mogibacterium sp.]|nr:bifunctional folylpolyglutamate synthase/dihydrofolate synthase [Mogibacterium sp.]
MKLNEAIEYINSKTWSQWRLGLGRTFELLRKVGDPQKELRFVHVAGTNGKGSTCAMLESILRASGYKTGMYPSPFIEEFTERIQVNGVPITDDALCELTEIVKEAADSMDDHPSQFEIITTIGMLYFARMKCDLVVLEVGLGGTYDSTNVIESPDVCVITNIGFDHTEYLGRTLAEITSSKAGIIKPGADVVAYPNVPEVMNVIKSVCDEKGCRLTVADFEDISILGADLTAQHLRWRGKMDLDLPLVGEYQARNVAVVLTAIDALIERGWNITEDSIRSGLAAVKWPARFEVMGTDPVFILDGGHNLQCAEAVAESLRKFFPDGGLTLLIGMLADKDYMSVLHTLLPFAAKCCCVTPDSDRALPAAELARIVSTDVSLGTVLSDTLPAAAFDSVEEAVRECISGTAPVLAFGSLYMAGEVRKAYRKLTGRN